MVLEIRLFARARDLAGADTVQVELPEGATIGDLRAALPEQIPELAPVVPQLLVAIEKNEEPLIGGRDNLNTMALVDAAYLSADQHRAVPPSEIINAADEPDSIHKKSESD